MSPLPKHREPSFLAFKVGNSTASRNYPVSFLRISMLISWLCSCVICPRECHRIGRIYEGYEGYIPNLCFSSPCVWHVIAIKLAKMAPLPSLLWRSRRVWAIAAAEAAPVKGAQQGWAAPKNTVAGHPRRMMLISHMLPGWFIYYHGNCWNILCMEHMGVYIYIYVYIYIILDLYTYFKKYICIYIYTELNIYIYVCVRMYINIFT